MSGSDREYKCSKCHMVITLSGSYTGQPEKKQGGPCPKDTKGEHSWVRK